MLIPNGGIHTVPGGVLGTHLWETLDALLLVVMFLPARHQTNLTLPDSDKNSLIPADGQTAALPTTPP